MADNTGKVARLRPRESRAEVSLDPTLLESPPAAKRWTSWAWALYWSAIGTAFVVFWIAIKVIR